MMPDDGITEVIDISIVLTEGEFTAVADFAGETMTIEDALLVLLRGRIEQLADGDDVWD